MIIKGEPNKKKEKTEDEQKKEMLEELEKESLSTICLACLYAKKFEETGMDITERWATAEQQTEIIQRFFYEGYEKGLIEGIERGKALEKEETTQAQSGEYGVGKSEFFDPGYKVNLKPAKRHRSPTKKKRRY